MKKGLLTITAGLLISLGVSAQYVPANWQVDNGTTAVTGLTGFYPSNDYNTAASGDLIYPITATAVYGVVYEGDVLKVTYTNPVGDNWADFGFNLVQWVGGTGNYFTTTSAGVAQESDQAVGNVVDMTDDANKYVTFKIQSSAAFNLRLDLQDLQGKSSNGASPKFNVAATAGGTDVSDASKWVTLTYSWGDDQTASAWVAAISDMYSGDWHGVPNAGLKDADNPLNIEQISKVQFTINDGSQGTDGETATVYIKDVVVGDPATTNMFEAYVSDIETISGAALNVVNGIVYSAGTITVASVSGQVVATADGELNIASLPAGVLVITTAEGSAKIVK